MTSDSLNLPIYCDDGLVTVDLSIPEEASSARPVLAIFH